MVFLMIVLLLIAALGYLAQTTGLCLVRGVNEAASGKPLFLLAIMCSGAFAWVSLWVADFMGLSLPFISYESTLFSMLGGFLFGLGAAFNQGCGVSTISKLARGQLFMLATISGWLLGWVAFANAIPELNSAQIQMSFEAYSIVLGGFSFVTLLFVSHLDATGKKLWMSMLAIGLMASLVFLYEPKWTPSGLLKDISLSAWESPGAHWPSLERFLLMVALIFGMVLAAVKTRSFKLTLSCWRTYVRHLLAGVLMGVGAVTAGGGNDTQLLLALPALSVAGLTAVVSMLAGIYLVRKFIPRS